jgi:hypothetical protein
VLSVRIVLLVLTVIGAGGDASPRHRRRERQPTYNQLMLPLEHVTTSDM